MYGVQVMSGAKIDDFWGYERGALILRRKIIEKPPMPAVAEKLLGVYKLNPSKTKKLTIRSTVELSGEKVIPGVILTRNGHNLTRILTQR